MIIQKKISSVIFLIFLLIKIDAQCLKIMPMGNSITYDENSYDEAPHIRPIGDRISYRYRLSQLITEAGYSFDFVGSENGGNNYFQNTELDDNAGFPGITDKQLAYLINTGYNQRTFTQVSPGPYLNYYHPDIILLHIGTNDLDESPLDVKDILDNIRSYDPDVIILVARIINRATYSLTTTKFNDNVELMIVNRHDDKIRSVNMETGAGINYSTDMFDNLHPNTTGYNKMAAKWFQAINSFNLAPELADVDTQFSAPGEAFENINLDNIVTDYDNVDSTIKWTYKYISGQQLSASIDSDRILHVAAIDNIWTGTQIIRLIAEDTGNGGFIKRDSVDVIFKVEYSNIPPVFISAPDTIVDENQSYSYTIQAYDEDDGNNLNFSVPNKPDWLDFNAATNILSGKPTNADVGKYNIVVNVTDSINSVNQIFDLEVLNVNDLPVITSEPVNNIIIGSPYLYIFTANDPDNDKITYTAVSIPSWLSFSTYTDAAILMNTPTINDTGKYDVILKVSDGKAEVTQEFNLYVKEFSAINDFYNVIEKIYPNPAKDEINIKLASLDEVLIEIFNIDGRLEKQIFSSNKILVNINVEELPQSIYICKITCDNKVYFNKFIK